jgi:UDP-2,3-diacylglucosamine hydrolase
MEKTFFIADVHIGMDDRKKRELVLSFFDMVKSEKGALYILGDFFDFWANNRKIRNKNAHILLKLKELTSRGHRVGMLVGNRDFLLNKSTLAPFGIDYLGEEAEVRLGGKRVLLAHGHTLCRSDMNFLQYKKRAWPVFRTLDKFIPGIIENYLAEKFILRSVKVVGTQDQSVFQFTMEYIEEYFNAGVNAVICGHAHRKVTQGFGECCFYALPAWDTEPGNYLLYDNSEFTFHQFSG